MKRKLIFTLTALALIAGAFLLGKMQTPSKYNYLNLNQITETQINGNEITITTQSGDCYTLEGDE